MRSNSPADCLHLTNGKWQPICGATQQNVQTHGAMPTHGTSIGLSVSFVGRMPKFRFAVSQFRTQISTQISPFHGQKLPMQAKTDTQIEENCRFLLENGFKTLHLCRFCTGFAVISDTTYKFHCQK